MTETDWLELYAKAEKRFRNVTEEMKRYKKFLPGGPAERDYWQRLDRNRTTALDDMAWAKKHIDR
jgi:hypothetical protein